MKFLPIVERLSIDPSEIRPFLFTAKEGEQTAVEMDEDVIIASPFATFSVEIDQKAISSTPAMFKQHDCIDAIICEELAPGEYRLHYNMRNPGGADCEMFVSTTERDVKAVMVRDGKVSEIKEYASQSPETIRQSYLSIANMVNGLLARMNRHKLGTVRGTGRVKFKDAAGKKQIYKPKDVIYVSSTPRKSKRSPVSTRHVNWTSAWEVVSHWRRLDNPESLGKDRFGGRNVKGFTFIGTYIKGKGKDVIIKKRIVTG